MTSFPLRSLFRKRIQKRKRIQNILITSGLLVFAFLSSNLEAVCQNQEPSKQKTEIPAKPKLDPVTLDNLSPHLVRLMRVGIETPTPNTSFTKREGRETLFDGSYDWHSCVIAHWALLVHARTQKAPKLAEWVLSRLSLEALNKELESLAKRELPRGITYPYDEAWFAMLLTEVSRQMGDEAGPLLKPRQDLEIRLLKFLENTELPEFGESGPKYCGFYRSAMFLYLCMRWNEPCHPDTKARLDAWAEKVLEPKRNEISGWTNAFAVDFLSIPGMLALIDRVDPTAKAPEYKPVEFAGWPESVKLRTVHILGLELTRVWPLAIDSKNDPNALRIYRERVESLLARPEFWAEDFEVCSHWIPQFLFIGEWLRAGRP